MLNGGVSVSMFLSRSKLFSQRCFCSRSTSTAAASSYIDDHLSVFHSTQSATLQSLHQSHAFIITTGNYTNPFFSAKLISLYASLTGSPDSAVAVFHQTPFKDTFLWNSVIKSHFSNGLYSQALDLYSQMRGSNVLPNHFTVPMVFSACAEVGELSCGMAVQGLASKCGILELSSAVGSSLIYFYCKCGRIEDACQVFDEMSIRDVVTWTSLIIGFVLNGESEKGLEYLCKMMSLGDSRPNLKTMEGGFQACGDLGALTEGSYFHALVVKIGLGNSQLIHSSLVSMYSKCGALEEACQSFSDIEDKDLLSWTSILGVYARLGQMTQCLSLFFQMQSSGIHPDGIVLSCMLLGFGNSLNISGGKAFHGLLLRRQYLLNPIVHNAMLSMYCKFGILDIADKLFDRKNEKDQGQWNIMVVGFGTKGSAEKCIELFREMQELGIEADSSSLVSVISSCSKLRLSRLGRSLHCRVIKSSAEGNVSIGNSLIDLYNSCWNLSTAKAVFSRMDRDVVSWNTMMSCYAHGQLLSNVVALFDRMILEGIRPNSATLVTVLSACSHLASLETGEKIHNYIVEERFDLNLPITTALVDMYGKCGKLEKSRFLFDSMTERDIISWNVMVSCYGLHGFAKPAIEIFDLMEASSVKPDALTFLGLLSACAHSGLVQEGKYLFERMRGYEIHPGLKHYACMVDLLGKSGDLEGAEDLVRSMPATPDAGVWGSLLSACKIHGETEIGVRIAKRAIDSDPGNDGYYVSLSNMYSSTGRWEEAETVRRTMKEKGVERQSSWSSIE